MPIIFIPEYQYITGLGWFGIEVMPGVQFHGIQLFFSLIIIASILFFAGLVNPKLSIWFGEKTRRRSSILYGLVVGIAILGVVEVSLIAQGIYQYEDKQMVSLYEEIKLGHSADEVRNLSGSHNKHLRYSYSLQEFEKGLVAYDPTRNFLDFSYPNQFRAGRMRMLIETNLHPAHQDARVIAKFLLVDYQIDRSEI
ncbi:MAG: hypothetical protein AAF353_01130 [Pseudomonadota bacterium]